MPFIEWMQRYFPEWEMRMAGSGLVPTWYRNGRRDEFGYYTLHALWSYEIKQGFYQDE
jgi:hypothetical protein